MGGGGAGCLFEVGACLRLGANSNKDSISDVVANGGETDRVQGFWFRQFPTQLINNTCFIPTVEDKLNRAESGRAQGVH